jgi:hypothetical protein
MIIENAVVNMGGRFGADHTRAYSLGGLAFKESWCVIAQADDMTCRHRFAQDRG